MERLFSPWRSEDIGSISKSKKNKDGECLFARRQKTRTIPAGLILLRRQFCFCDDEFVPLQQRSHVDNPVHSHIGV